MIKKGHLFKAAFLGLGALAGSAFAQSHLPAADNVIVGSSEPIGLTGNELAISGLCKGVPISLKLPADGSPSLMRDGQSITSPGLDRIGSELRKRRLMTRFVLRCDGTSLEITMFAAGFEGAVVKLYMGKAYIGYDGAVRFDGLREETPDRVKTIFGGK